MSLNIAALKCAYGRWYGSMPRRQLKLTVTPTRALARELFRRGELGFASPHGVVDLFSPDRIDSSAAAQVRYGRKADKWIYVIHNALPSIVLVYQESWRPARSYCVLLQHRTRISKSPHSDSEPAISVGLTQGSFQRRIASQSFEDRIALTRSGRGTPFSHDTTGARLTLHNVRERVATCVLLFSKHI